MRRRFSSPGIIQLASSGNRAPTLTPSSNVQSLVFTLSNLIASHRGLYRYAKRICVEAAYTITGGGGNVLNHDAIGQIMDSFRLYSPVLGELFPQPRTRGADVANFDAWLGSGYRPVQPARAQIASAGSTDYTGRFVWSLPFAMNVFDRPDDFCPWIGFLEGGILECRLGANNVLNSASASAVLKGVAFTFSAWIEYYSSPDAVIHTPKVHDLHEWNTAGTQIKIQAIDSANGLKGLDPTVCRLAALGLYGNDVNFGGNGVADLSTLTRLAMPWRDQESVDATEAYIYSFLEQVGHRTGYIVGGGASSALHDGGSWPFTMAAAPNGSLQIAALGFMPIVMPSQMQQISKLQKVAGDLTLDTGWSANPSGTHRLRSVTPRKFDQAFVQELQARMGKPVTDGFRAIPKLANKQPIGSLGPQSRGKLDGQPLKVSPPEALAG
ncbi:MAG: hypothetical protein JO206_01175 [Solirubrobacterales bacterium]|nr:hypothetical protein [Solirubrobacterales bacterium]MBV9837861.1 hypothetical protein [Solirubrobacterales bacterium]